MALTFANFERKYFVPGGGWRKGLDTPERGALRSGWVDITLDTNGPDFAVTAANLGLVTLHSLIPPTSNAGHMLEWDHVTGEIKAFFYDYDGASDGPAIPITGAELDTKVIRCYFEGW